ncbi:MAG: glutamate--cysteine ligase [Betaproteobacteria bacterium]|nr:MAG: glutamate--cysteine ligase [Betaproteobacteria bacterium]
MSVERLAFKPSAPLTMGVELELQLVNSRDCDLTRAASDLLSQVAKRAHPGEIKPEITESMIEVSTGVHVRYDTLTQELRAIRGVLLEVAEKLNVGVCGGGAHPFQHWSDRRIMDAPRMKHVSQLYGYLAKQFTVFGQHVHIGCPDGDAALYLLHAVSRYIPHLIALSAASPYYQGVDTAFESSRLNAVFAFPLSGRAPFVQTWDDFNAYFGKLSSAGIVDSMKDFYWDIRPKPEFGTIEIRVCDTPLTVERAAALAAYAQALARWLLVERPHRIAEDLYLAYTYNRFQACRFGLGGEFVDPVAGTRRGIGEEVLATLEALAVHARELGSEAALGEIESIVRQGNDARWMRERFADSRSLPDLVWRQVERLRARA